MKTSSILGLNARSQRFTFRHNTRVGKRIAKSKIITARLLRRLEIPTPIIYKKFFKPQDIVDFNWEALPDSFALKPSKGMGGGGIIVLKKRIKSGAWITTQKDRMTVDDLKLHVLDILEGAFSIGNIPDSAFLQEYVGRHKAFAKYSFRGTPDIRVIVFNKVPVMAMLRLPTKESGGRANLHQGAVGVGIDIATGITTKAIWHATPIKYKPDTKRKLHGIKIPQWTKILETATRAAELPGLGYMGADIVLHPERGPMILEVNSQPGLQIQLANMAGLKKRLERVEDLEVSNYEQGVKIAKALFSERFADRVRAEEGVKTIKAAEEISLKTGDGKRIKLRAKIDTGAWSSAIDIKLAKKIGLYSKSKVLWYRKKISALGQEERAVIEVTFWLAGRRIKTTMTVADRSKLTFPIIIGRTDLDGFLVNPEIDPQDKLNANKW